MTFEIEKQEIKDLLLLVKDEDENVRFKIGKALECINDPPRHPIVTNAIANARKRNYPEIALKLANIAYESNPDNPYFLVELCTNLSFNGKSQDIIDKIGAFLARNNVELLPQAQRDAIMVTYASAFKGIGKPQEGIKVLEQLKSNKENVVELLSELYFINSEPKKIIKLLAGINPLSPRMALWQGKALDSVSKVTTSDIQDQKSLLVASVNRLDNSEIKSKAISALQALDNLSGQSQSRIVTKNIKYIRKAEKGKYKDFALELAITAHDVNPDNPFYLGELSVLLIHKGEHQIVIDKIIDFLDRVEKNGIQITDENREYLVVDLAHAYSGIGDPIQGIKVLKELKSEAGNVKEALAELYCIAGEPKETLTLLQNQELTEKMAYWLAKSYIDLSMGDEALNIINLFSDRDSLKSLRGEAQQHQQRTGKRPEIEEKMPPLQNSVFIVHGHEDSLKQSTARFLEKLGLQVIILHEQPDKGRTIIEKLIEHSSVMFAVVLLTHDDVGGLKSEPNRLSPRARQNVIFEMGFFYGKLGRGKICALYQDVEQPSDLHGVLYIPVDQEGSWKLRLAKEIKAAGLDVDLNRVM